MKKTILIGFAVVSALSALAYLLSCLTPFISAKDWIAMGFIGLGFPLLLAGMLLLVLIWILVNKKVAMVLLICVLIGFKNIENVFGSHFNQKAFSLAKQPETIRVIGYNVRSFAPMDVNTKADTYNDKILNYIAQQDPDIICMQDFFVYRNNYSPFQSNVEYLQNVLHLNYYSIAINDSAQFHGAPQSGIALFSRYPLQNIQQIKYSGEENPESIIVADITIHEITHRLLVTHLQSMWLNVSNDDGSSRMRMGDSAIIYSNSRFKKLDYYLAYHAQQARELKQEMNKSPYPVILSLDMNEVPSSYCYYHISNNLNDAFLQKSFGLGRTYYAISPTLRIDYLLTDPLIEVVQYKKDDIFMSDHYPQVMDVKW